MWVRHLVREGWLPRLGGRHAKPSLTRSHRFLRMTGSIPNAQDVGRRLPVVSVRPLADGRAYISISGLGTGPIRLNGRLTATNLNAQRARAGHLLPVRDRRDLPLERLLHSESCRAAYRSDPAIAGGRPVPIGRLQCSRHLRTRRAGGKRVMHHVPREIGPPPSGCQTRPEPAHFCAFDDPAHSDGPRCIVRDTPARTGPDSAPGRRAANDHRGSPVVVLAAGFGAPGPVSQRRADGRVECEESTTGLPVRRSGSGRTEARRRVPSGGELRP